MTIVQRVGSQITISPQTHRSEDLGRLPFFNVFSGSGGFLIGNLSVTVKTT